MSPKIDTVHLKLSDSTDAAVHHSAQRRKCIAFSCQVTIRLLRALAEAARHRQWQLSVFSGRDLGCRCDMPKSSLRLLLRLEGPWTQAKIVAEVTRFSAPHTVPVLCSEWYRPATPVSMVSSRFRGSSSLAKSTQLHCHNQH